MPRRPQVNYDSKRNSYRVQLNGKQYWLGPGPDDAPSGPNHQRAVNAYLELLGRANLGTAGPANTVRLICETYLDELERRAAPDQLRAARSLLKPAVTAFGSKHIGDLKRADVLAWLNDMAAPIGGKDGRRRPWGESTRRTALAKLTAAFNWARQGQLIERHCLEDATHFRHIRSRARGAEAYLGADLVERLLAASLPRHRDLWTVLWQTGCRPAEAANMAARYFHPADGCIVYPGRPGANDFAWKNARKTGKDRTIFLRPPALEVVGRLIAERPAGPIFRTRRGRVWKAVAMGKALGKAQAKLKAEDRIIPYSFRHTYATNWLLDGRSIKLLAELLGTSVAMLEKHYAHLEIDRPRLRSFAMDFNPSR